MKQIKKTSGNAPRSKKEKWNFKPWLIIGGVILVIVAIVAVITVITGLDDKDVLEFTYENGEFVDEKNDITYVEAPFYYQSKLMTSKDYPYAASENITLYRVGYRDEKDKVHLVSGQDWLSTSMDIGAMLYYNPNKVELPALDQFEGDEIYICEPDGSTLFTTTKLDEYTTTRLLDDFFATDDSDFNELYIGCELVANLKVSSSKYPWLYLNLWLYTDAEGNYYLCENITRKFLKTDEDVFAPILATAGS